MTTNTGGPAFRVDGRHYEGRAAEIVGIEGWRVYSWQMIEGSSLMKGCVPAGVFTKGPRKGGTKWRPAAPGTERTVAVSEADAREYFVRKERHTGLCQSCEGTGEVFASWSATDGVKKRPCLRCNATGIAPKDAP